LLELATNAKLENNIYHRDVIDAMFRQPFSATAKPFKSNKVQEKFIVHAVDYDLGRNGVAYFDNDTADYHTAGQKGVGNRGRMYRNDGVDIHKDSAHYESYYVSDIEQGEWLQYTLDVTRTGTYNITITVATDKAAGKISISSGTLVVTKNFGLPATGGSTKWQTVVIKNVKFNKGSQALRVYADEGGFNLQLIELSKTK